MAKVMVKNNGMQPCYVYLLKGNSVKIPARKTAEVDEEDLKCPDMAFHLGRGNLTKIEKSSAIKSNRVGVQSARGERKSTGGRSHQENETNE
ncbi:MAG: hypothetical protein GWN62_35335 [Aliifodinibius sp.]|nr:hypothetical protein [Fodinibius sp.]